MKIGFISLGCAKNLVDSEYLIGLFSDPYFEIESDPRKCDVILINTCGFIESAKVETIDTILEMAELKEKNLKYLIVTGCFTQRYYEECLKEFPEVDLFVRIDQYPEIDRLLGKLFDHEFNTSYGRNRKLITNSYSAYLKIGDGCDNRCTYCAIPLIRGSYRSYPEDELVKEAERLYSNGVRELNVVAQDSTKYGIDINSSLANLLRKLDKIDFRWIRVLYMYPDEISDELLEVMAASKRILPYFDIPVQYGNDEMLQRMNRRGTVAEIKERITAIRKMFKEPVIRTTIIIGFPYESEETFRDTLDFVRETGFDSLGAYTYSREEDTPAYDMPQVDEEDKERRYDELMSLQQGIAFKKNEERIGRVYEVLVERYESLFDRYIGRSYMSAPDGIDGVIYFKSDKELKPGDFADVKITSYKDYDLIGEHINHE
ncbi:MAG: 30S ribosomal protein S12 methylthiotransferase RimO [Erysipelotrichaceae bacterium]|nr:30S ribosomal protein S12 methylthiotransferase RimO [Erysipelotrichaceae bacterium]